MNLFIVESYYHLLISIIKAIKSTEKSDLMIVVYSDKSQEIIDINLIKRLKNENIFNNIIVKNYIEEDLKPDKRTLFYRIKRIAFTKKEKKNIKKEIKQYKDIYIYNDITLIGKIINSLEFKYILLEDGTDCFKNNRIIINSNNLKGLIINNIYGIHQMGKSKNIKHIEVNNKENINIDNTKIIEFPKEKMFNNLSNKEIDMILRVFDIFDIIKNLKGEYSLLITQPLYRDHLINSESKQLNLYKIIIDKFLKDEKVLIKTHPREKNIYNSLNNVVIITKKFPIEIINFLPNIKFNKVVTISSTSVNIIKSKEKIILGWEWLEKYKNNV